MNDSVAISLTSLLNGSLPMGAEPATPARVLCDLCGYGCNKVAGDDEGKVVCNKCFFSMEENH